MKDREGLGTRLAHSYLPYNVRLYLYSPARQPYEVGIVARARWPNPQTPPQRGRVRERDYIAGKGSFVRAIANFANADSGCDSVDVTSVQLTNRYVISVTIM